MIWGENPLFSETPHLNLKMKVAFDNWQQAFHLTSTNEEALRSTWASKREISSPHKVGPRQEYYKWANEGHQNKNVAIPVLQ